MAAQPLAERVGVAPARRVPGAPQATFHRRQRPTPGRQRPRPTPARALREAEREQALGALAGPRFVDRAPAEVVAVPLNAGRCLRSERTMHRILAADRPVRERRNQRGHPQRAKPEPVATAPNRAWSRDIAKPLGPAKRTHFHPCVALGAFSRCAAGWMVADRGNPALAGRLVEEARRKQGARPQAFAPRSGRGAPMTGKRAARPLADLGATRSLGRPRASGDNRSPRRGPRP